jgi:hypothetical protein
MSCLRVVSPCGSSRIASQNLFRRFRTKLTRCFEKRKAFGATSHSLSQMELKQSQSVSGIGKKAGSAITTKDAKCFIPNQA